MVHYTFIVISERLKSVGINISPEWVQTEDSVWYIRYEKACNLLEQRSMANSNDMYMNERIDMRGFV